MSRGRWKVSEEYLAQEAYAVLIRREKASRTYLKAELAASLSERPVYVDFLKLCFEYDDSSDLQSVRKGLLFVVRALGASQVAKKAGISRVSLYRMLSSGGNPRLKSLHGLSRALGLRLWMVEEGFVRRREGFIRPRDVRQTEELAASLGRRIRARRQGG